MMMVDRDSEGGEEEGVGEEDEGEADMVDCLNDFIVVQLFNFEVMFCIFVHHISFEVILSTVIELQLSGYLSSRYGIFYCNNVLLRLFD